VVPDRLHRYVGALLGDDEAEEHRDDDEDLDAVEEQRLAALGPHLVSGRDVHRAHDLGHERVSRGQVCFGGRRR
jgi:hypothetical protein